MSSGSATHGFGISIYGIQYATGYAGHGTPFANPKPMNAEGMLKLAVREKLNVLEVSPSFVSPSGSFDELRKFRTDAESAGVRIVMAASNVLDVEKIGQEIDICRDLGVSVLRCTMSGLLRGDRSPVGGYAGFKEHVAKVIEAIRRNVARAERARVTIAVENHQDADSETLLEICKTFDSPSVGVTLDAGNPLAVGEDPIEFATRILPFLADVHLKDYEIITTDSGYRLVHCAIGDGVVDFQRLWELFETRPNVPRSIEMAAWNERHIKVLTPEWWTGYGPRDVRTFVPVVALWRARGLPDQGGPEWRTPLELGDSANAEAWENERLARSIANLSRIEQRHRELHQHGDGHGTQA